MKKQEFQNAINSIHISPSAQRRILSKSLTWDQRKEQNHMVAKKKIGLLAAAAVMILGITVFAASGAISVIIGGSREKPDYTALPSEQTCIEDAGFTPILLETFSNGYTFDNGNVIQNTGQDEQGKPVESFRSFLFRYTKADGEVLFSQKKLDSTLTLDGNIITTVNGIPLFYTTYTARFVPDGYEKSQAELQAEQRGELVFSYGTDAVQTEEVQGLSWSNGTQYFGLTQIDGSLSAEELVQMATELIAMEK